MVIKSAQAAIFGDILYLYPLHVGESGASFFGSPEALALGTDNDRVGKLLLEVLELSRTSVVPGTDETAGARELLRLAGVKTWTAFEKKAKMAWIDKEVGVDDLLVKPMERVKGGTVSVLAKAVHVNSGNPAACGGVLRRMLAE
jgi:hypothetical protein